MDYRGRPNREGARVDGPGQATAALPNAQSRGMVLILLPAEAATNWVPLAKKASPATQLA